jgi:hypothetical protein
MFKKSKAVTAVEILKYARALLAKRGGWTKTFYARSRTSRAVAANSPNACRFCAYGALLRAVHDLDAEQLYAPLTPRVVAFNALEQSTPDPNGIVHFNDKQATVRPILAVYDKAIAKLEANNG